MDIVDRLRKYMEDNNLRPVDLANKLDINKSYLSKLLNNKTNTNVYFLERLSETTGRSINWWLHGTDNYNNLYSLNELINTFIEKGFIKYGEPIEQVYKDMLYTMLDKEIEVKLLNIKKQEPND